MHLKILFAIIAVMVKSLDCRNEGEISRLNFFDIDLLRYSAEDRQGNVMISPASIKSMLSMILEGSSGATEAEIRSALRLSPEKNEYREQLNLYLTALNINSTSTLLKNSNAIFVSKSTKFKREYEIMLQYIYKSEINKLDFNNTVDAATAINDWVKDKTKGIISSIIDPVHINPSSEILIVNTLYFKSAWKFPFDPKFTQGACFYVREMCQTVAMMDLQAELNYAYVDNLRAHALELPYADSRYSMIILLPQDRDGCVGLIRDLPYMSLPQITSLMDPYDVQLSMPKFTVDYGEDLIEPLMHMRIRSLFSKTSNLSGIFEGSSPQINNIYHRVQMNVDEMGTVAAAASSAMIVPLIGSGVTLRIDRPFVFFIRDNVGGLVLFEGKIDEPTAYVKTDNQKDHSRKSQSSSSKRRG